MGFYATGDVQPENRYYPVFRTEESENRLTTLESLSAVPDQAKVRLEFTYDYMGRRVTKTVFSGHNGSGYQQTNEVTFVYDGWNLIAALDEDLVAGTTSTNFYLWGLDLSGSLQGAGGVGGLLATSQDGASYFACMDGNGNVMALVDATDGTLAGEYEYGPFGEPLKALGDAAEDNAVRFSSKYTDSESGLLYYGYRYLDPSTGRWVSRDPIEEDGGANLYSFVENDPPTLIDLLGLVVTVQRTGKSTADVYCDCGDTVEDIAEKVKLEADEYLTPGWLWAADGKGLPATKKEKMTERRHFKSPNEAHITYGVLGRLALSLSGRGRDYEAQLSGEGYKVIQGQWWTSDGQDYATVNSLKHLKRKEIAIWVHLGHGSESDKGTVYYSETGAKKRYRARHFQPAHKLERLYLFACFGAHRKAEWLFRVAKGGSLWASMNTISALVKGEAQLQEYTKP